MGRGRGCRRHRPDLRLLMLPGEGCLPRPAAETPVLGGPPAIPLGNISLGDFGAKLPCVPFRSVRSSRRGRLVAVEGSGPTKSHSTSGSLIAL